MSDHPFYLTIVPTVRGWTESPKIHKLKSWSPPPQDVTLFSNSIVADAVS